MHLGCSPDKLIFLGILTPSKTFYTHRLERGFDSGRIPIDQQASTGESRCAFHAFELNCLHLPTSDSSFLFCADTAAVCEEWVSHPVLVTQRDTFANFFHDSEDFFNVFIAMAVLDYMPGQVQMYLTDLYPKGPFW